MIKARWVHKDDLKILDQIDKKNSDSPTAWKVSFLWFISQSVLEVCSELPSVALVMHLWFGASFVTLALGWVKISKVSLPINEWFLTRTEGLKNLTNESLFQQMRCRSKRRRLVDIFVGFSHISRGSRACLRCRCKSNSSSSRSPTFPMGAVLVPCLSL